VPAAKPAPLAVQAADSGPEQIDTWDVFDTLIARYCMNPTAVFDIVAQRSGMPEFPHWRRRAQADLDARGQPYAIHDIYRKMIGNGVAADLAQRLLRTEIAVEAEQSIPIRRNLERVGRRDLMVSDMYLGAEAVSDLVAQALGPRVMRPPVVGNWGKATGAVWPHLLKAYRIGVHHGDNPHSDLATPSAHGIACELTTDHLPTPWEAGLFDGGEQQLALLLRECRLRSVPRAASIEVDAMYELVCGPLLTILLLYAIDLRERYADVPAFVFASRDGDQLAAVFRALYPSTPSLEASLNRVLCVSSTHDAMFNEQIPDGALIVELIASGRTVLAYTGRNPHKRLACHTLLYADRFLNAEDAATRSRDVEAGRFGFHVALSACEGFIQNVEAMVQPGYDKVIDAVAEAGSGAVVRRHGIEAWTEAEEAFLDFKHFAVRNLIDGLKRRPIDALPGGEKRKEILARAIAAMLTADDALAVLPSFYHREQGYFQDMAQAEERAKE